MADEVNTTNSVDIPTITRASENGTVSDLDLEHADTIIKVYSSKLNGRKNYTKEEDIAIVSYIIENRKYQNVTGKTLWIDMEVMKTTNHSWESMKGRYLKTIVPNIDWYDIPNSWKSLITGDTSKAVTENSDKNQRYRLQWMTDKKSPKKPAANKNVGLFGDQPPCKKTKTKSQTQPNILPDTAKKTNDDWDKNDSADSCEIEICCHKNDTKKSPTTVTKTPAKSPIPKSSTPKSKRLQTETVAMDITLDDFEERENVITTNSTVEENIVKSPCLSYVSSSDDEFDQNLYQAAISSNDKGSTSHSRRNKLSRTETSICASTSSSTDSRQNKYPKTRASTSSKWTPKKRVGNEAEQSKNINSEKVNEINNIITAANNSVISPKTKQKPTTGKSGLRSATKLHEFVMIDISESQTDDETQADSQSTMMVLNDVIQEFNEKYGMSKSDTVSALWYHSGSVKDTINWIEFGVGINFLPPWTESDDMLLNSAKETDIQRLTNKYSQEGLLRRILFFEDLIK